MRDVLRFTLFSVAASVAAVVMACSSSDTSAPASGVVDGGNVDSGGNPADGASADAGGDGATDPDASSNPDTSTNPDAAAAFTLTSTAFAEGASIPADNTCNGTNVSPPLAWSAGPAGTKSYAVVLNDVTITFLHSIIYDIPANVMALPAAVAQTYAPGVPAGAHQTMKNFGGGFGYAGPCPPKGQPGIPDEHVYELVLYALDVANLPGADMSTTVPAAETLIKAHSLGSTKLTGRYKQP